MTVASAERVAPIRSPRFAFSFTRGMANWGNALRSGLIKVTLDDVTLIAGVKGADG